MTWTYHKLSKDNDVSPFEILRGGRKGKNSGGNVKETENNKADYKNSNIGEGNYTAPSMRLTELKESKGKNEGKGNLNQINKTHLNWKNSTNRARELKTANAIRPWEKKVADVIFEKDTRELGTSIGTSSKSIIKTRNWGALFLCEVWIISQLLEDPWNLYWKEKAWICIGWAQDQTCEMPVLPKEMWEERDLRLCSAFCIQEDGIRIPLPEKNLDGNEGNLQS